MVSVYDVETNKLILEVAKDLKKKVKEPLYASFVKTGVSRERAPDVEDWWYIRMSSVLRKFYTRGVLGVEVLRGYYGDKQNLGVERPHFAKASGKIIRDCVQKLEGLGYVTKVTGGRQITVEGRKYLDSFASKVSKEKAK